MGGGVGLASLAAPAGADVEPALGPRHRDVEKAALFRRPRPPVRRAHGSDGRRIALGGRGVDEGRTRRVVEGEDVGVLGPVHDLLARADEEDGLRLQPLRVVDRHDAHRVAGLAQLALHLALGLAQVVNEGLKRRGGALLEAEGEAEELVERVAGLEAQPREEGASPTARAQHLGEELEGPRIARPRDPVRQARNRALADRIGFGPRAQRRPEPPITAMRDYEEPRLRIHL